jgi:hypothetical protein
VAFHAAAVAVATYPAIPRFRSAIPENPDAWQHLWIMHWYKTCLLEGRSPYFCPEIQYPVGAPLGNFSPLHFQSLLFVPLSFVIASDTVCYNIVWLSGLLLTGFGTTLLAWHLVGHRGAAAFAGLLAMLSAPMMIHASAHLELVWVGWFPIFLVAWMTFVDRPSRGRLALAALGYVLVAMSAAYYMVFAVFPAVLYVLWGAARCGRRGAWPWLRCRIGWFLGMVALTLPCILVLFSGHIWALAHGFGLERSRAEFGNYGAPLWGFLAPTTRHLFGKLLGFDPYQVLGPGAPERVPYLGVATVVLLPYAAALRSGLRRASYVWLTFALLAVLALGASWKLGRWEVALPSSWLWDVFPPYRMTRVPARFALFVGVPAGVLAAAGLRDLLQRLPGRAWQAAVFAGLAVLAVGDLAMVGFPKSRIPRMPGCYAFLKEHDPKATILEVPNDPGGTELNALCTYWQSRHRLTTSAGYSGHDNHLLDALVGNGSPFLAEDLSRPDYLAEPGKFPVPLGGPADFREYLWLYLTANRLDYVVLHRRHNGLPPEAAGLERLRTLLGDCTVYEDGSSTVLARARLGPPTHPLVLTREGFAGRNQWQGRWNCLLPRTARVVVYNPDAARELSLVLDAAPPARSRVVSLQSGTTELARWELAPGSFQECASAPFRLPAGLHELTLTSRAWNPGRAETAARSGLRVARVGLETGTDPGRAAITTRSRPESPAGRTETKTR